MIRIGSTSASGPLLNAAACSPNPAIRIPTNQIGFRSRSMISRRLRLPGPGSVLSALRCNTDDDAFAHPAGTANR